MLRPLPCSLVLFRLTDTACVTKDFLHWLVPGAIHGVSVNKRPKTMANVALGSELRGFATVVVHAVAVHGAGSSVDAEVGG